MKNDKKYYGYSADRKSEDKRISRLKKAYKARNNAHLFCMLIDEAEEKILNQQSAKSDSKIAGATHV